MKIHQLPLGARFEYQGEEMVKTGPMFASGKGGQRLIPRHAVLRPLDPVAAPQSPASPLDRKAVLKAFDAFCATCAPLIDEGASGAFEDARRAFVDSLA